jgi:hypothetical protein
MATGDPVVAQGAPPPPPISWQNSDDKAPGPSNADPNASSLPALGVPNGRTTADTATLDLFAKNINAMIPQVQGLTSQLNDVDVQPGAFYHADAIRAQINGLNGDSGLKAAYLKVVGDLAQGLSDINTAVVQMSAKYQTTEDLNKASATDLQTAFQNPTSDFGAIGTDAAPPSSSSS